MHNKLNDNTVSEVYLVLNGKYGNLSLGDISQSSKEIESDIKILVMKLIFDFFSEFYDDFKILNGNEFQLNGGIFQIRIGAKISAPILEIHFLDIREVKETFIEGEIEIQGVGYYSQCELYITKKLNKQFENIQHIINSIYRASYRWLEENIEQGITKIESNFTNALYLYLRMVFDTHGKPELTNRIWFSIFSEKNGYYALDSGAIERILSILKQRKYVSEFSPAYHISSLLGLEMPFDKSFSKYAINKNDYEEFSLPKASYMSDMAHIYKTEEQMTEGAEYAIYPIARIGNRELVASFPADIKNDVLPILKTHKSKLSNIYETEVNGMTKHIKIIKTNYSRMDSTQVGGLIGGILGGVYKAIS